MIDLLLRNTSLILADKLCEQGLEKLTRCLSVPKAGKGHAIDLAGNIPFTCTCRCTPVLNYLLLDEYE